MRRFLIVISSLAALFILALCLEFYPPKPVVGIDLSHNNELTESDWQYFGKEAEFVYLKASEGGTYQDPMRRKLHDKALEQGLHIGAYHFFRDNVDAGSQFDNYKDAVKDLPGISLIPCIDYEKDGFRAGLRERVRNMKELNSLFFEEYGLYPVIYCNILDYATIKGFCPRNPYWISIKSPSLGVGIMKQEQREVNGKIVDFNKLTALDAIKLKGKLNRTPEND